MHPCVASPSRRCGGAYRPRRGLGRRHCGRRVKAADIQRLVGVSDALDIIVGWAVIVAAPALVVSIPASGLALMVSGGIAYAVGAIVFLRGRPDPRPNVFGFHAVWPPSPSRGRQPLRHGVARRRVGGAPTSP
jgi:hypothetical protein